MASARVDSDETERAERYPIRAILFACCAADRKPVGRRIVVNKQNNTKDQK
jgi:hypothetical protein